MPTAGAALLLADPGLRRSGTDTTLCSDGRTTGPGAELSIGRLLADTVVVVQLLSAGLLEDDRVTVG